MPRAEDSGRDRILARIRSAVFSPPMRPAGGIAEIFAPVTDPLARFQAECTGNNTECFVLRDWAACVAALAGILSEIPTGEIFVQDAPPLRRAAIATLAGRQLRWSSEGPPAEASAVSVTLAELLVAQTGSVVVSTACGGRGGSIVAPVHVVLAHAGQLVAGLADGLERIRASGALSSCSSLSLITGPSRTADIEKILVLGAHGPRRIVVLLAQLPE